MDKQVDQAIGEYKKIAEIQTEQGFILKGIAVYKKILKIQPANTEVEHLLSNLSERLAITEEPSPVEQVKSPPLKEPEEELSLEFENKLLKDLRPDEFKQVVAKLNLRHFEEGAVVVKEGDPGDSLFIVVRGEVRVLTHTPAKKEVFLANLGEGEFFGEIALLTGKPRTATVIANITSELLELTKKDYEKIIQRYPNVKKVVEEFHVQRTYKTVEAMIQATQSKS
jgi:cAMP-dependent protein kinase regulator